MVELEESESAPKDRLIRLALSVPHSHSLCTGQQSRIWRRRDFTFAVQLARLGNSDSDSVFQEFFHASCADLLRQEENRQLGARLANRTRLRRGKVWHALSVHCPHPADCSCREDRRLASGEPFGSSCCNVSDCTAHVDPCMVSEPT